MQSPKCSLDAADGYFHLGLLDEAVEELNLLPRELRMTDSVLETRIAIYHKLEKWAPSRVLAESLAQRSPENQTWWIHWAYSLRREKSVTEARGVLWQAVQIHPASALIHYNLACYASVLGEIEDAVKLLTRAVSLTPALKLLAIDDSDLESIFGNDSGKLPPGW